MTWLSLDASFICLALENADGTHACTLDIHPQRWTPTVSFEHAVRTLLAALHNSHNYSKWAYLTQYNWMERNYEHPDVFIAEGGLNIHQGPPVKGAKIVRMTAEHVVMPNGEHIEHHLFSAGFHHRTEDSKSAERKIYSAAGAGQAPKSLELPSKAKLSRALTGMCLGASMSIDGLSFARWHQMFQLHNAIAIVGTQAGRILSASTKTGQEARQTGQTIMCEVLSSLFGCWAVRPDRVWSPSCWITASNFDLFTTHVDPLDIAAGKAGMRAVLDYIEDGARVPVAGHTTTSHQALALRAIEQAVERALLTVYRDDLTRLKPGPARKAKSLALKG